MRLLGELLDAFDELADAIDDARPADRRKARRLDDALEAVKTLVGLYPEPRPEPEPLSPDTDAS